MTNSFVGIMSGTSCDGLDFCLIDFKEQGFQVHKHWHVAYPSDFHSKLLRVTNGEPVTTQEVSHIHWGLGRLMAQELAAGLDDTIQLQGVGIHGHTVFHGPELQQTLQLGAPQPLAAYCNAPVYYDFRSMDVALGGQGAPLVPLFDEYLSSQREEQSVFLNLGGIANLSYSNKTGQRLGWDTGPGNILLDRYCQKELNRPYDEYGVEASKGDLIPELLQEWLQHPYFSEPPPKSTGRELFTEEWINTLDSSYKPCDILNTLTHLTLETLLRDIEAHCPDCEVLYIGGGGVHNHFLVELLTQRLSGIDVELKSLEEEFAIHPDAKEAAAFAYLAYRLASGMPTTLSSVTGASYSAVSGCICPPAQGFRQQA